MNILVLCVLIRLETSQSKHNSSSGLSLVDYNNYHSFHACQGKMIQTSPTHLVINILCIYFYLLCWNCSTLIKTKHLILLIKHAFGYNSLCHHGVQCSVWVLWSLYMWVCALPFVFLCLLSSGSFFRVVCVLVFKLIWIQLTKATVTPPEKKNQCTVIPKFHRESSCG